MSFEKSNQEKQPLLIEKLTAVDKDIACIFQSCFDHGRGRLGQDGSINRAVVQIPTRKKRRRGREKVNAQKTTH